MNKANTHTQDPNGIVKEMKKREQVEFEGNLSMRMIKGEGNKRVFS